MQGIPHSWTPTHRPWVAAFLWYVGLFGTIPVQWS